MPRKKLKWQNLQVGKCYDTHSPNPNHQFQTRLFCGAFYYPGYGNSLLTSVPATEALAANRLHFREPFPIKPDVYSLPVEFAELCSFTEVENPYA